MSDPVLSPLMFSALAALAFLPLERLWPAHAYRRSGTGTDVWFATLGHVFTNVLLLLVLGGLFAALDVVALEEAPWARVRSPLARNALQVGTGLLLFELAGYAYHRAAHRVPFLWRLHEVHHSSESLDFLASFRQHPIEIVLMTAVQNAPLVYLGIPLGSHALILLLLQLNTVFVHANLRVSLGPLTWLLATPAFHHRHHQRAGAPRNFASLFPFLDRLFGTYCAETAREFGLPQRIESGFLRLLLRPLARRG